MNPQLLTPNEQAPRKTFQKWLVWGLVLGLLLVDQAIKFVVKLNMTLGEDIPIFSWFHIYFIENMGMAYGIELGSKLLLTLFRLAAMGAFAWGIGYLVRQRIYANGFIASLSMVLAGGIGNIIDSLFYGLIFSDSHGRVAELFPATGGYGTLFHGKVVDMFWFPLINTTWPSWIPFIGGKPFTFFDPVFNFADACISVGVVLLLLFYTKSLGKALESFSPKNKKALSPK